MPPPNLTAEEIDSLEFQTTQAFEAMKRAVKSQTPLDATWAAILYGLDWNALPEILSSVVGTSD